MLWLPLQVPDFKEQNHHTNLLIRQMTAELLWLQALAGSTPLALIAPLALPGSGGPALIEGLLHHDVPIFRATCFLLLADVSRYAVGCSATMEASWFIMPRHWAITAIAHQPLKDDCFCCCALRAVMAWLTWCFCRLTVLLLQAAKWLTKLTAGDKGSVCLHADKTAKLPDPDHEVGPQGSAQNWLTGYCVQLMPLMPYRTSAALPFLRNSVAPRLAAALLLSHRLLASTQARAELVSSEWLQELVAQ